MMQVRIIVSGRVQGVGYRDWAVRTARAMGLAGWVRNRRDGSVEIVAGGDPGTLANFESLCREGPPAAKVASVESAETGDALIAGFEIRRTG